MTEIVIYISGKYSSSSPIPGKAVCEYPKGLFMPRTCLIAAHDPWLLQLLRVYSEESGFRVVQAYEGQDVLPIIEKEVPAAILLQVDLPGQIKGIELLNVLHTDPLANRIPVIAFSWQNEGASEMEKAAAYLEEPVTYEAFVDTLRKLGICG
jgi:two-component system, response regulator, stage 0 sporulation protein F